MMAFRQVLSPLGIYNCPAHRGEEKARITGREGYKNGEGIRETNVALANMLKTFDATHECRNVTCLYNGANWWLEGLVDGTIDLNSVEALPDRHDYYL